MFNNPLIHPTALIHENAKLGKNVSIGPYTIIGSNCSIGDGTIIDSHCVIDGQTSIGSNCHIFPSVSIGLIPQDYNFKGEETGVSIGNNNIFREFVTIHRATGQGLTKIGDNGFFMNYVHIAHNCNIKFIFRILRFDILRKVVCSTIDSQNSCRYCNWAITTYFN